MPCSLIFSVALLSTRLSVPAEVAFVPVPAFGLDANPLLIERAARQNQPFSVVGQQGAILGRQDGTFKLWSLPVKVLHNARLTAHVEGYDVPIALNECASAIQARPDHTTIVYSHAAITVLQHMFLPRSGSSGVASAIVLFEIHAIRRAAVTLSFAPSMERQWPALWRFRAQSRCDELSACTPACRRKMMHEYTQIYVWLCSPLKGRKSVHNTCDDRHSFREDG